MKKVHHASPIILAILCAVGVHTVLFTDAGHRLQGAITESTTNEVVSNSSLVLNNDTISLVIQKDISKVSKITASLAYDNGSLILSKPESTLGIIATQTEDFSQNSTLTLSSPQDITKGTVVATWKMTTALPEIHTINLSDVSVESSEGNVNLSTKGTGEF